MSEKSERIKQRVFGGVFALAWMWPLIEPGAEIAQGRVAQPVLGAVGLLAFIGLYVTVVTLGFDDSRAHAKRGDLVMLYALALVGFALVLAYGDTRYAWSNLFLYIAVSGAALLGSKTTPLWVAGAMVLLVLYSVFWSPTDLPAFAVGEAIFEICLASVLVHTMKQLLRYVRILHDTRSRLARAAVDEERLRFARDLHDLLGHTLSLIVVKAEVVRRMAERDPQEAARAAGDIETIGRRALAEVRQAVDGYRQPQFDAELPSITGALQDAGIAVLVTRTGDDGALAPEVNTVLGWAVREATTNVIRHSDARTCRITLAVTTATARLEVLDDGPAGRRKEPAGDADPTGAGLLGLRERLEAVGGTLTADHHPGGGFLLVATIPTGTADAQPPAQLAAVGETA